MNVEVLSRFVPLDTLEEQFLSQAAKNARLMTAKKGTIIFKRGKVLSDLCFLVQGEVNLINNEFGVERVAGNSDRAKRALNTEAPTAVSAIAKTPVTFLSIPIQVVEQLVAASHRSMLVPEQAGTSPDLGQMEVQEVNEGQDWMSCLLQSPILSRLPLPQLQELFKKFEKVYAKKGERVIREGAKGDYFYVLASGTAVVTDCSGSVYKELKPGQYFGEEALISDAPRNASITMTSNGILKRLSAQDFADLLKNAVLRSIEPGQLQDLNKPFDLLDIRMPVEFRSHHQPGSINIPLSRLRKALPQLPQNRVYLVSDEAGRRAHVAVYLLCQAGLEAMLLKSDCVIQERQSA